MRRPPLLPVAFVLAAAPAVAASPPPWLAPVTLADGAAARPSGPAVAIGRSGALAIAWERPVSAGGRQVVEAVRRARPSSSLGPAVEIDRVADSDGLAAVGVARDGTATVGWLRGPLPSAAAVPQAGPPGPVVPLPASGLVAGVRIGADEAGTATAAWAQREASAAATFVVAVAERPRETAAFSAPRVLGASSGPPGLAVAGDGRAIAAWIGPEGAVWAALRDRAGTWGPAERRSATAPARGVSVAVGSAGGEVVAWLEDAPAVAIHGWQGEWSAPQRVAPPGPLPPKGLAAVATDLLAQTVAVAWRQGPAPLSLRVGWRGNPARPWRISRIADPPRNVGEPALVMSQSGDALVAWSHPLARGAEIRARVVPRGGPLGPVEAVSTGSGARVEPAMAIGTGGTITAAWVALPPPRKRRRGPGSSPRPAGSRSCRADCVPSAR